MSEGGKAAARSAFLFVAVVLAGFIVSLIVVILGGDCGTAGDDAAVAACVREKRTISWTMMAVTAAFGLWASVVSFRRRD